MTDIEEARKAKTRVAVVTGGASGIGLGICRRLAQVGYPVAMLDLHEDALQAAAKELEADGLQVFTHRVDVTDRPSIDAAMAAVRKQMGPISIIIANAGIDGSAPFEAITADAWNRILAVNLTGVFHTVQACVGDMVAAGWGRIITISSQAGQSGGPERAHYVASKGGVIALTKALSIEFAPKGVTANTIPPSLIETPMAKRAAAEGKLPPLERMAAITPVRRIGTPDDIAAACVFLCSDGASFITGQQIGVNGGLHL